MHNIHTVEYRKL